MSADLISRLRAAGDPLHLEAAEAITAARAREERLLTRLKLIEGVTRLNGETIRTCSGRMSKPRVRRFGASDEFPPH
jgi:hypothetical protein